MSHNALPAKQGLYNPNNEHDACGVGFIAHIKGEKRHAIVQQALEILTNLTHRGAVGADPLSGDGAGMIIQIPDAFLREECASLGLSLPAVGDYGVGLVFLPQDDSKRAECEALLEKITAEEGQSIIGWRDVPVNNTTLGESVKACEPVVRQYFVAKGANCADQTCLERKLFVIRKRAEHAAQALGLGRAHFYFTSFSSRTINYKGMLLANQVGVFYQELNDARLTSALALVHQRFSTNTFPTWDLAHPFRMIAHNGEINTVKGNVNWMRARRHAMSSAELGEDLEKLWPLIGEDQSDSACFDNALELLVMGGYSMAHAMMMLIPEAWSGNPLMDDKRRSFYEYHAALMEPWDGPAAVAFTDGRQIGATLDRNGLRPARYLITDDDIVVMASEMGVLNIPEERIIKKWRLQPGKMFLVDVEQGRIIDDAELKTELSNKHDYQAWLNDNQIKLNDLPAEVAAKQPSADVLLDNQQAFGYTQEDIKFFIQPMAENGMDPIGSMGIDTPIAALSKRSRLLYDYFKQAFAQVTNPAIDPIREELVMSLIAHIGPRPNLLNLDSACCPKRLETSQPILSNIELEKIRRIESHTDGAFKTKTLDICYSAELGADGMQAALEALCVAAVAAVNADCNILILSDRAVSMDFIAIPALLATSAVHQHLTTEGLRTQTGLVIETGDAREVHHCCLLAGYGAEAINPYLALDSLVNLSQTGKLSLSSEEAQKNYIKAVGKGMLKVMSKMGVSTYQSYCGGQIFDAVGLQDEFVNRYFNGTASMIEGSGLAEIAAETVSRHQAAYGDAPIYRNALDVGGEYAFRLRGEEHVWTPETITNLQHAVRDENAHKDGGGNAQSRYDAFAKAINDQNSRLLTIRGLMDFNFADNAIPLEEVEPVSEIVKRFVTGAMSFGSISFEAHTTLAIAMNKIGGKSNTGEGGELPERFKPLEDGSRNPMRSAIKQVASGRFGVTTEYLVNADDIQIKISQGAKPGEGGQLPGHKVNDVIAKVRHSTAGVGLISPPPHHDIYSIEDIAQLIHDLKNVNPQARISVKLVSEIGVGTVAAGVSKAHADHITIAGYDGGTGASPVTSIKHAGSPWEIGLAETQQTMVLNDLRGRVTLQVDGGMRTGRDVIVGALLGADEFGFATAPLIAEGCIMMRKCHLNTCPVGVATQNPELRKRFSGKPEHVINYFFFVAEEVRQYMAKLGFRNMNEMVGQVDKLNMKKSIDHWKAKGIDLSKLLHKPDVADTISIRQTDKQDHGLMQALDNELIKHAQFALDNKTVVAIETPFYNYNRSIGAMLSGEVALRYGHAGLPDDTITINAKGCAGQSLGAFLAKGITIKLAGDGNDYVGKGLSGGKIIIAPPTESLIHANAADNIIAGNTVLYGAVAGECYFNGVAGERFAVRNSGATAVVEGVGDHGCEYMTGGLVLVLGATGRNFAAGMSGGVAYVLDEAGDFEQRCNPAMVALSGIEDSADIADFEPYGNMLAEDAQRIRTLIEDHVRYTDSSKGKTILANWDTYLAKFIKVMPVDYRRALENARDTLVQKAA